MPGNRTGGLSARNTNIRKYGADFYARIGAMGGKKGRTDGFACVAPDGTEIGRQRAVMYGAIGGSISKRRPKQTEQPKQHTGITGAVSRLFSGIAS